MNGKPPKDYKRIRVHFIFNVKHDRRHKARLVARGHLTNVPLTSVYSRVVLLCGIRLLLLLVELNGLNPWSTNIGNAYLEAKTKEKVFIIARKEFSSLEGYILVMSKALCRLCSSRLC